MTAEQGKRTRSDAVYSTLRADILGGRRLPGTRLKFSDLAADCDASMSVIREALTRLAAEGLVSNEPNIGFAVTDLSTDRLAELTDARLELESLVFARSIGDGDLAWESQLVAAHHVLEGTTFLAEGRVSDDWAVAHQAFHTALLAGCRNRRLFQIANGLRDEAELYRRWSQPLGSEKNRDLAGEHRRLLEHALARDVEAATEALRAHISHTTALLLAASESLGVQ